LSGDGYSAEYDVWTGKVTWRKATKETIKKQKSLTSILMIVSASLSPFVVAGLLLFVRQLNLLGSAWSGKIDKYTPIILGVILFLSFDALMLAIRVRDPIAQVEP
ncbi:membrane protein, partial [Streptococcus mutans 3SN1]